MKTRTRNKVFALWTCFSVVCSLIVFADAKSGGSGGGGGRGGGGGTGRAGGRGGRISGKKVALGAAAVGVAGYAAYKQNHPSPHRFHSNPLDNPAFNSGGGANLEEEEEDYKIQESSYYNRGEGFGMSAFGLLALILGFIGLGTLMWYCMEIFVPIWRDRQMNRNRQSGQSLYSTKEGHPLQETPSTVSPSTPSPS